MIGADRRLLVACGQADRHRPLALRSESRSTGELMVRERVGPVPGCARAGTSALQDASAARRPRGHIESGFPAERAGVSVAQRAPGMHRHRLQHDPAAGRRLRRTRPSSRSIRSARSSRSAASFGATAPSAPPRSTRCAASSPRSWRWPRRSGRRDPLRRDRGHPPREQRGGLVECLRERCPELNIEVLSPRDEARLAFTGVVHGLAGHTDAIACGRRCRRWFLRTGDRRPAPEPTGGRRCRSGPAMSPTDCYERSSVAGRDGRRARAAHRTAGVTLATCRHSRIRGRRQRHLAAPARRPGAGRERVHARTGTAHAQPGERGRGAVRAGPPARAAAPRRPAILRSVSALLGVALEIGHGGLREGVCCSRC